MGGEINFIQLVERLNMICFGTLHELLEAFFDVFDIDGDGQLDAGELEELGTVFFDEHSNIWMDAKYLLQKGGRIKRSLSKSEFVHLAVTTGRYLDPRCNNHRNSMFVRLYLKPFGLDASNIDPAWTQNMRETPLRSSSSV